MKTRSEKNVERSRRWCKANPERCLEAKLRWQRANPEKRAASQRRWQQANKEKCAAKARRYRKENSEKCRETARRRLRTRYASEPNFRLLINCCRRIHRALHGKSKSQKTRDLIGCSIEQLREWLEAQFEPGMSWSNHGDWHIDHIRPCASFDLFDPTQQKQCFNFTNLQPLWATDNIRKGAKII